MIFQAKKKSNKTKKKQITFFLSSPNKTYQRAFNDENIFEILRSIKDVSYAVSNFKDYKLLIKIHPGDTYLIPILKLCLPHKMEYKIMDKSNNYDLIKSSKIYNCL